MPLLFSLPIFFLCVIYTTTFFCSAAPLLHPAVVDTSGNLVKTDLQYYIKPAKNNGENRGGGLGLCGINGDDNSTTCPLGVVQEINEQTDGLSVSFFPAVKPQDGLIRGFTDLNVQFNTSDTCNQGTVWRIEESEGQTFGNLGGKIGDPGAETSSNWFKIERIANEFKYKLAHCPTVCASCQVTCGDVGIFLQYGKRRLALSQEPYEIIFERARRFEQQKTQIIG